MKDICDLDEVLSGICGDHMSQCLVGVPWVSTRVLFPHTVTTSS